MVEGRGVFSDVTLLIQADKPTGRRQGGGEGVRRIKQEGGGGGLLQGAITKKVNIYFCDIWIQICKTLKSIFV